MGQPNRLSPTNVLPFPGARVEVDSSPLRESQVGDYRADVIERPPRLVPQRRGIFDGYLLVPLHGEDRRAILDTLEGPYVVSSSTLRFLVIALVLLAVLPSLSVATVLWLSKADTALSPSVGASANHGPVTEAIITLPSISTPTMLKATPGESTSFPIVMDGTEPVEGGGTIAISRLPRGSSFSLGSPDGETRWKLAPGEIDNLHLVLSPTVRDETTLVIELLAPDGHVISDTATIVEVATVPEVRTLVRRVKTEVVPGHVWDRVDRTPEAMETQAEPVSQTMALPSDPVPLPTKRPGPRRQF